MTTSIEKLLEKLLMLGICIVIALTYILHIPEYVDTWEEVTENEKEFNQHPLVAWKTTHEKWDGKQGDIVKIKYRVKQSETKLWMYNRETGKLVHEQSLVRNPKKDGTPRDLTYVWKLYKSERSQYIPPGDYDIVRGGPFEPVSLVGKLITTISI
jgi:hypothetical protein